MTPRSPGAFLLSATFHALLAGMVFMFSLDSCQQEKERTHVLELVAGEGDNFGATVAPKLGTPDGLKVEIPSLPEPQPEPPAPAPVKTIPVEPEPAQPPPQPEPPPPPPVPQKKAEPAPQKKPETKKAETPPTPNMAKQIRRKMWAAEAKAKREIAKERAAEEKRQKDLEKARAASAARSARIQHIDAEGIARGVVGGSAENKVGGAGGKALSREEGAVLDAYYAMLVQRVQNALDKPAGLSDELVVTVHFHISASGRVSGARVVKSSGSDEFDRAVITAFGRVSMPPHPEHRDEDLELNFRTKDVGEG